MNFHFTNKDLLRLFVEDAGPLKGKFPAPVIRGFFDAMDVVADAADERILRSFPGLRFEKLKGDYEGCYSIRVNQQYRLVFRITEEDGKQVMEVLEIIDYHK